MTNTLKLKAVILEKGFTQDKIAELLGMTPATFNYKSETLSRHSVTYFDLDVNQVRGYPASLLGFLESYRKARF